MNDFLLPEEFCNQQLPRLQDADLIKLLLYLQIRFTRQEGENKYLFVRQILQSSTLQHWMGADHTEDRVREALKKAVANGLLISAKIRTDGNNQIVLNNDENGKTSLNRLQQGLWLPHPTDDPLEAIAQPQKNIYQLYEENIGPLTPLLSEDLTAAQEEYPSQWIEEAIHIAVQNNARSWRYVDAVLKSWQKEGKDGQSRRNSETYESRRNKSSEFDDFIQH
jgi:DnaD/phage-associated family protein